MRYALLICHNESAEVSPQQRAARAAAFTSFQDQMRARGVLVGGERLHSTETATSVRAWDGGDMVIADGPFAETKEQIAGFYLVECGDLDEAIEVATKVPAVWYGTVEVRPVREK